MDRKQFFKELAICAAELIGSSKIIPSGANEPRIQSCVRPPGAHPDEDVFLSLCTGCDACMAACPVNAIIIDNPERRDPFLYLEQNPCIFCPGTPCISACPTGALDNKFGKNLRDFLQKDDKVQYSQGNEYDNAF